MDPSRLNPAQRRAVDHGAAPLLVLAGAGTGKTMVITYRIARLIADGLPAHRLLAVTFTNKAAREMRERAAELCRLPLQRLAIGTFHATCARLLRQFGEHLGLGPRFVIYDQSDQLALIKRCARDLNIPKQLVDPRTLRNTIERWKNDGWRPREVRPGSQAFGDEALRVYELYEKRCRDANAVDFGGLLVNALALLRDFPEVRDACRGRWSHVLVDEYQDTNRAQAAFLRQLITPEHSLTVVGDDDQSIYSWRGANVANILDFDRDYPGATLVRLERNYRSTQTILDAANAVIAHNAARKGKDLYTEEHPGEPVELCWYNSELEEGEATAREIAAALDAGAPPQEIAILYRVNAQSRPFEEALRRRRIPYAVFGGIRFYDRREVKDALAYLRLIDNPSSELDFLRAVSAPARGIGRTSLDRLDALAAERQIPLFEAARLAAAGEGGITARPRKALGLFVELIDRLAAEARVREPKWLINEVVRASGYWEALEAEGSEEAEERRANLRALIAGAAEYAELTEEPTLAGYLEEIALIADIDGLNANDERVSLMTLHSAKGLEFDRVFLTGLEEGLFPHARSLWQEESLEEERRLCYVGLTRAKRHLTLSAAGRRFVNGVWSDAIPSRFLQEIPRHLIAGATPAVEVPAPVALHVVESDGLAPGMRVFHATFGEGDVVRVEGAGLRQKVVVDFPEIGPKTIIARYVERL